MDTTTPYQTARNRRGKRKQFTDFIICPTIGRTRIDLSDRTVTYAEVTGVNSLFRVVSKILTGNEDHFLKFRLLLTTFVDIFRNLNFNWHRMNPNTVLKNLSSGKTIDLDVILQALATLLNCRIYLYTNTYPNNYSWLRYDTLLAEKDSDRSTVNRFRSNRLLIFIKTRADKFAIASGVQPFIDLPLPADLRNLL
uniref:Uncharacterized protein n=1 Tax=Octopus bimaculoides TaxID=37653 RepID=A0A0L8HUG8_OCTBM